MNNNILVTGTYGFIGSHFLRLLVNSGYKPIGLGRRTTVGDKRRIKDIDKEKYKDYEGDICDKNLMERIIKDNEIDIIVNFGAVTHVDNSIKNSEPFIHSNYLGVHRLLEMMREKEYNIKKMIQISTDEVYGDILNLKESFDENSLLRPSNPYSSSKAGADLLCLAYKRTYGLDICITRSCNNFGPGQADEKFIPRMIKLGMEEKDLEVYGNGNNIRQWIYVTDNCNGICEIMKRGTNGEIYNIGSPFEFSNNQVAKMIGSRFGVGIKYIEDRPGHDIRYSVNYAKIFRQFRWELQVGFEEGLNRTIDSYIVN